MDLIDKIPFAVSDDHAFYFYDDAKRTSVIAKNLKTGELKEQPPLAFRNFVSNGAYEMASSMTRNQVVNKLNAILKHH